MPKQKVAVAMSGGVDSSVAAARLKEAGHKVSGFYLKLWSGPKQAENMAALENTCRRLDIPLAILDLGSEFRDTVVNYFCQEYRRGRTPNPCIVCNQQIKFGKLLTRARESGADFLATGHYARIETSPEGYHLLKAADTAKDQSYFLYRLGQKELAHILFPLGELTKGEVRKLARERKLVTAKRPESQDVCFIPDGDYRSFLARHIPLTPGDIVDTEGKVLGRHSGLANYTVGQRQGLGIAAGERRYVIRLDATTSRVVVGAKEQLRQSSLHAATLSWVAGRPPADLSNLTAKIRYGAAEVAVKLFLNGRGAAVEFLQPQSAITPGQAIVIYQGNKVLGGGIIE
jgi:tRNA-specific 2-thiouridylase